MNNKFKIFENGYSLLTNKPIFQIIDSNEEIIDVGPYTKEEAEAAVKLLNPKVVKKVAKKVAKKTTKK
jgi:hypothetical protein|tara:strand:- start:622 stop:825 length:204 start_codon:yes stop_codon:yes gene_type:complete